MVRLQQQQQGATVEGQQQADAVQAYLSQFGSVDRYLTSVQDYLPYLRPLLAAAASAAGEPADADAAPQQQTERQAHAAVLQQLATRTPQLLNGTQLYAQVEASRIMPLGCASIDNILSGGLRETTVTEIAGETCSGKTQLCHLAAVMTAQRSELVLYFDTTNAFSADRARQMIEFTEPERVQATLANITVVRCHSVHALLASLDDLAQRASSDAPKLIIVDSISALLSPVIGATQHNQGHVLVAETARLLRHTAAALQCSVLLTNHVVGAGSSFAAAAGREEGGGGGGGGRSGTGGVNSSFKPALGEQWKAAAHMRLQLSRGAGGTQDLALATLLTHPMQPPGAQGWFRLDRTLSSC